MQNQNDLKHWGIMGMKWGVRKAEGRASSLNRRAARLNAGAKAVTKRAAVSDAKASAHRAAGHKVRGFSNELDSALYKQAATDDRAKAKRLQARAANQNTIGKKIANSTFARKHKVAFIRVGMLALTGQALLKGRSKYKQVVSASKDLNNRAATAMNTKINELDATVWSSWVDTFSATSGAIKKV